MTGCGGVFNATREPVIFLSPRPQGGMNPAITLKTHETPVKNEKFPYNANCRFAFFFLLFRFIHEFLPMSMEPFQTFKFTLLYWWVIRIMKLVFRWELKSEAGSRIRLDFNKFYLTSFGGPNCLTDSLKVFSGLTFCQVVFLLQVVFKRCSGHLACERERERERENRATHLLVWQEM